MCSEFSILCGRGQGVHVATPLQEIRIVWVGLNRFDPRNDLWCRDWHRLHESSYCYLKIHVGTHNLTLTC